mmetsp:Transcript_51050/g.128091  ORF Transcript_51050/g.128091 Transcript_51050/m.128091 type:complete len:214 (-) Transcript_51050:20-661(-)
MHLSLAQLGVAVCPGLGQTVGPLTHECTASVEEEIGAGAFFVVLEPAALVDIAVEKFESAVSAPLVSVPLAFVHCPIGIPHGPPALPSVVRPLALISVAIAVELGAPAVSEVILPAARVHLAPLSLLALLPPQDAFSVTLVALPLTLVFCVVSVQVDTVSVSSVVIPLALVGLGGEERLTHQHTLLIRLPGPNPVHRRLGPFLSASAHPRYLP